MTSAEFIAGLAEIMGVERTELATVDRALAKAGLRQISRGRFRPDITLEEGLRIAVAWAGAENLTEAAEEVRRLKHFALYEEGPRAVADVDFVGIFGKEPMEVAGQNFWQLLVLAARSLGLGEYKAEDLTVIVEKRGNVDIKYGSMFSRRSLCFSDFNKFEFRKRSNVTISVRISGNVLKWIFDVTEGK